MRRLARRCLLVVVAAAAVVTLGSALLAETKTPRIVSYTLAQAGRGKQAYDRYCASCHGVDLDGIELAPALDGERFALMWPGKKAADLFAHVRRMPLPPIGEPGSLPAETYADIVAFLLDSNGVADGDSPLSPDAAALAAWVIPRTPWTESGAPAPSAGSGRVSLRDLPPVTDETLRAPAAEDWPIWRRTYDSMGWSPLREIDRENVGSLELAWRAPLGAGENMASPLVYGGVMYLHTFPDTTIALDASNGAVLWSHRYQPKTKSSKKMGIALHGDRVIVPTSDLHLLALNAKTGELIWDHAIAIEAAKSELIQLRGGPLVAGRHVIQGVESFRVSQGSFVVALDLDSGRESWRFYTVARPGEPGGDTWNDLPLERRNGGSVWVTGSYDPKLDLVYFGPAPTYDTAPLLERVEKEGTSNEALFTNATVALDAKTGKLAWYYQHLANDQWDLDWAFERQVVDLPIDGTMRRVVVNVGKLAIVEALDAATGEYLFSIDLGLQNVVASIDPETGKKRINPGVEIDLTAPRLICPTVVGARSWPPTSFDPETKTLYLPLTEGCNTFGPEGFKGLFTSGIGLTMTPHPVSSDGNMGRLQAVNLATRQMSWSYREPTPLVSSTIATGGGLVFVGDLEPSLKAFDSRSGELLWRGAIDDTPGSSLITYAAGGRQYVAVVVGQTNNVVRDWSRIYRAFAEGRGVKLDEPPTGGAAIWAFALPR